MKSNILKLNLFILTFISFLSVSFAMGPTQYIVSSEIDNLNCQIKSNHYLFFSNDEMKESVYSNQIIRSNNKCKNYQISLRFEKNNEDNLNENYNYFNCKSINGKVICDNKNLIYEKRKNYEKKHIQYNFRSLFSEI